MAGLPFCAPLDTDGFATNSNEDCNRLLGFYMVVLHQIPHYFLKFLCNLQLFFAQTTFDYQYTMQLVCNFSRDKIPVLRPITTLGIYGKRLQGEHMIKQPMQDSSQTA